MQVTKRILRWRYPEFRGNLTSGIVGFYRSVYTDDSGRRVPIATSKFQPTYARRCERTSSCFFYHVFSVRTAQNMQKKWRIKPGEL